MPEDFEIYRVYKCPLPRDRMQRFIEASKLGAGGKPSTRFSPGTLVELSDFQKFENFEILKKIENVENFEKN